MKRPPWKVRRRLVIAVLLFCALIVGGMALATALGGLDTALAAQLVVGCLALAGSTIGAYVFGATWDDKNVMQAEGLAPYQDESDAGGGLG